MLLLLVFDSLCVRIYAWIEVKNLFIMIERVEVRCKVVVFILHSKSVQGAFSNRWRHKLEAMVAVFMLVVMVPILLSEALVEKFNLANSPLSV